MSNIPNYEQWGKMNDYLNSIAVSLGSTIDVSTWEGVQKAVRLGLAPDLFPIGTQLMVHHNVYGDMMYDVVAHDHYKSVRDENAHTMTLLSHDFVASLSFNGSDALYYAENELPAGTYHFTIPSSYLSWEAKTYKFTLTKALPKGGQLTIEGGNYDPATATIKSYSSRTATVATEECAITVGNSGTNLGTVGVELNHIHRVTNGSDNYKESAIRQFLNSSAEADSVWIPQTKFGRPPSWVSSTAGFMKGLDEEFLNVVGTVVVPCSANGIYESPDSTIVVGNKYTVTDKFYLPSSTEIFGTLDYVIKDDSTMFPYYKGATNADRIKYRRGVAGYWWVRSGRYSNAGSTLCIDSIGDIIYSNCTGDRGCVVACTIV